MCFAPPLSPSSPPSITVPMPPFVLSLLLQFFFQPFFHYPPSFLSLCISRVLLSIPLPLPVLFFLNCSFFLLFSFLLLPLFFISPFCFFLFYLYILLSLLISSFFLHLSLFFFLCFLVFPSHLYAFFLSLQLSPHYFILPFLLVPLPLIFVSLSFSL